MQVGPVHRRGDHLVGGSIGGLFSALHRAQQLSRESGRAGAWSMTWVQSSRAADRQTQADGPSDQDIDAGSRGHVGRGTRFETGPGRPSSSSRGPTAFSTGGRASDPLKRRKTGVVADGAGSFLDHRRCRVGPARTTRAAFVCDRTSSFLDRAGRPAPLLDQQRAPGGRRACSGHGVRRGPRGRGARERGGEPGMTERRMFGGLGFMVDGQAVAASGGGWPDGPRRPGHVGAVDRRRDGHGRWRCGSSP